MSYCEFVTDARVAAPLIVASVSLVISKSVPVTAVTLPLATRIAFPPTSTAMLETTVPIGGGGGAAAAGAVASSGSFPTWMYSSTLLLLQSLSVPKFLDEISLYRAQSAAESVASGVAPPRAMRVISSCVSHPLSYRRGARTANT